ncbi:MAG: leucine-rich repeat domain-containing protein [Mariniblastus sp.]
MSSLSLKSLSAICLLFVVCATGCKKDYEAVLLKKEVRELKAEIEDLKKQLGQTDSQDSGNASPQAVTGNEKAAVAPLSDPKSDDVPEKAQPPVPPAAPAISLDEEKTIRDQLSSVYFMLDDEGYAFEADLTECGGTNDAIAKIVDFPKLTRVLLDGTKTTDETFDSLAKITNLEYLSIERCNVSAGALAKLKTLKRLNFFQLFRATLNEDSMKALSEYPSLAQIRCGQTRVGDAELATLAGMKTLKAIDLSDCNRVSINGLRSLAQCPNLSFLKVYGKNIDDAGMEVVATMRAMKVLGVNDTRVTDKGIKKLAGLDLRELHLFRTQVSDEGAKVISQMPNIVTLNLRDTKVSDEGIAHLVDLKKMTKLDLSETNSPGVTDASGQHFAKMTNLVSLNLWHTQFTDAGVKEITDMPKLTWLNLDDTAVTDKTAELLGGMPQLTWLHLGKTQITDEAVPALLTLENLKYLNVSNTKITDDMYYELDDFFSPKDGQVVQP